MNNTLNINQLTIKNTCTFLDARSVNDLIIRLLGWTILDGVASSLLSEKPSKNVHWISLLMSKLEKKRPKTSNHKTHINN
jgi:hypothetical protein